MGFREGETQKHGAEDDQNLPDIAGQKKVDELPDVGIDDPALLDGRDDAGEVVVREDHVRRLLGDVRSGDAHCHTDVRPFQGRASFTPSPVMATM